MTINALKNLTQEEHTTIYNAPILIAILIASADGKIDENEIHLGKYLKKLKKEISNMDLLEYYSMIGNNLEDKLKVGINRLPSDLVKMREMIVVELMKLNEILQNLDQTFAAMYYESLKYFAEIVAKASGGIFGFNSIGSEESELIKLGMIKNPKYYVDHI
jgi:hypothetical protein